jgi:hypothetical protein
LLKKLLIGLGLVNIFALAFFAQLYADDYCGLEIMTEHNPLTYALHMYQYWGGTFFTLLIQGAFFESYILAKSSIFVGVFVLGATAYLILKMLDKQNVKFKSLFRLDFMWVLFLTIALFWIGFRKHIGETVYWATGMTNIITCFAVIGWFLIYEFHRKKSLFLISVTSFILGMLAFTISPAAITFMIFPVLVEFFKTKKWSAFLEKKFVIALVCIVAGTIIISIAPGNFSRASLNESSFGGNILVNYAKYTSRFIAHVWHMIPLTFLFVFSLEKFFEKLPNLSKTTLFKWCLITISTVSPFAVLNSAASPRGGIHFHLFFGIFLILSFAYLCRTYNLWPSNRVQKTIQFIIALAFIGVSGSEAFKAIPFYQDYQVQLQKLNEVKDTNVDFKFLRKKKEPRTLKMVVFSKHKAHWSNVCMARYYGVNSIVFPHNLFWGKHSEPENEEDLPARERIENHYLDLGKK